MIKAKIRSRTGRDLFLLGLSQGNIDKLRAGLPIVVDLAKLGGPSIDVAIMWGETEEAIQKEVMSTFGGRSRYDREGE